jgi:hypothetical protein
MSVSSRLRGVELCPALHDLRARRQANLPATRLRIASVVTTMIASVNTAFRSALETLGRPRVEALVAQRRSQGIGSVASAGEIIELAKRPRKGGRKGKVRRAGTVIEHE